MSPVVVLVGPPGAGKSTVAARLAERLGVPARDTDADVEAVAGTDVADIFFTSGEPEFRRLEREAVTRALTEHDGVLALGGGAPVQEEVRAALAGHRVVFLDVGLAAATKRVGMNGPRPLLIEAPRAAWTRLMDERRPVYTALAELVVTTTDLTPDEVADRILEHLQQHPEAAR